MARKKFRDPKRPQADPNQFLNVLCAKEESKYGSKNRMCSQLVCKVTLSLFSSG